MKLAEALSLANQSATGKGKAFRALLACGFTPQHAKTFLIAHLVKRAPDRRVLVEPGLYGDLMGTLERFDSRQADAVAVIVEWADLDPRLGYRSSDPWRLSYLKDVLETVSMRLDMLQAAVQRVAAHVPVSLALPGLALPPLFPTPLGWGDPIALALQERVYRFATSAATVPSVRLVNPQRLDQLSPPALRHDPKNELRWDFPYTLPHTSALCELLAHLILPASPKKAIITDLDDTLWRGVVGEDGLDGISWDLDHFSHGHAVYQRMLASLADLGVLVGVASKNDPKVVKQALARHDLIVPADVLFPVESHWGPKSESVGRILQAWNIGADSVVFIDDSPLEVAEVTTAFPDILGKIFPVSDDAAVFELLETLRDLFGKASVTEEDRLRLSNLRDSYHRRSEPAYEATDDVLAQLQAEITLSYDKPDQRTFDLINKTNQFNLNGRRIDESSWRVRLADPRYFLLTVSYKDKFGPLGKIAVVSGTRDRLDACIDIWVMSCRAFSRRIEHQILQALFEHLGADALRLDLAPTERNGPLRQFVQSILGHEAEVPLRIGRSDFVSRCPPLYAKVNVE
ncbi:MAG: HAD-IIIC family phosphatase [Thermoguttaceae bacterium]|jgi:FkbH-like protein